jgi:uncharacterized membrane protein
MKEYRHESYIASWLPVVLFMLLVTILFFILALQIPTPSNDYINCSQVDCSTLSQFPMWGSWITTGLLLIAIICLLIIKLNGRRIKNGKSKDTERHSTCL